MTFGLINLHKPGIIVDFGKKALLKKHPSKEKKHIFSQKKAPILQKKKSTFGAEKKHLVNIIL